MSGHRVDCDTIRLLVYQVRATRMKPHTHKHKGRRQLGTGDRLKHTVNNSLCVWEKETPDRLDSIQDTPSTLTHLAVGRHARGAELALCFW